ncbi:DUF4435 domain-containing protein [Sphaerospermopsis sp. FACHB-1194]|uniref:DUF4435 domain-containing protein n=1 Tax=Sphaerospermopsis sp. FACHB-1194 TaxID=2692862 RepID=UPI001680F6DB|nr:DUF4435 domain-containing protein [Sphaerospermopsis sp. FACHB-1194]MBD2148227.1 DUF4435 domain-containing protein [Sphaerospermopsis sp. FACHB-1194]
MKDQDYEMLAKRMVEDAWMRGCDISVLVEDIYDQRLWECIIENVKPELRDKIDFPNPVPKGTRGKDVLKKFKDFVSEKLIICVDSDCEYLYDDQVWYIAKYIYHTVVYSKENETGNAFPVGSWVLPNASLAYRRDKSLLPPHLP